jgi:hypothetical protein
MFSPETSRIEFYGTAIISITLLWLLLILGQEEGNGRSFPNLNGC